MTTWNGSPMTAKFFAKAHKEQMVVVPQSEQDLDNMRLCLRLKIEDHPHSIPNSRCPARRLHDFVQVLKSVTLEIIMYMAQCMQGHSFEIHKGSMLEDRAKAREVKGYLDAICVKHDDCPDCLIDEELQHQRFVNMCASAGCAFGDDSCKKNGCKGIKYAVEAEIKYEIALETIRISSADFIEQTLLERRELADHLGS
jgi:hypothetical protein